MRENWAKAFLQFENFLAGYFVMKHNVTLENLKVEKSRFLKNQCCLLTSLEVFR